VFFFKEILRKKTLREQEEQGFHQRMQAEYHQLEMQRTLHKEALRRQEEEMQHQRAIARHTKDQKSRNKTAVIQQPSTCATTPLTPKSRNHPKMTPSVSQKKPEPPLSFALIKLRPQPQYSMSTPIYTKKTQKPPS
jgi:myo-inositol-1-phosphate synthase